MSEVKDRVKMREIVKEPLLKIFKEKFEELTPICVDRIVASNGDATCVYHDSSPTDCRFSICPKLDLSLHKSAMIEASSNLKRRRNIE